MDKIVLRSFAISAALLLLSASAASAQTLPSSDEVIRATVTMIFGSDFPDYALTTNGFLQYVIFPFVALFAVMYGIMTEIKIFKNSTVKAVISLTMALVAGSWVLNQMRWFLAANATLGTWAFGLLMLSGIVLWFLGTFVTNLGLLNGPMKTVFGRHLTEGIGRRAKMNDILKKIDYYEKKSYTTTLTETQAVGVTNKIEELKREYKNLENEERNQSKDEGENIG